MKLTSYVAATALLITAMSIGLLFSVRTIEAQTDSTELSEAARLSIQTRCSSLKTNLRQLHTTDALLRVNMGQTYDSIATGLMSRLNSRLVLNRLDGAELVTITNQFDDNHEDFRLAYQVYDDELLRLINTDCEQTPDLFYERLQLARQSRRELNATVRALNSDIRDYSKAFSDFKNSFVESDGGAS